VTDRQDPRTPQRCDPHAVRARARLCGPLRALPALPTLPAVHRASLHAPHRAPLPAVHRAPLSALHRAPLRVTPRPR
jgi:hypothetical protein